MMSEVQGHAVLETYGMKSTMKQWEKQSSFEVMTTAFRVDCRSSEHHSILPSNDFSAR